MQVLKTLKRVAAIGTGVAMLGATLTGALALDLKDYPAPFVSAAGVYDDSNVFVYGDNAIAADTAAIGDLTASMQYMAKTPVVTSGSTVSVTGGKAQTVPLGQGLSNGTYFDTQLQDDDIDTLFDGVITFGSKEYDTSEELQLCDKTQPFVATSLMSDDDYKRNVFFEFGRDAIKYAYKFDETIILSSASTTSPIEIEFLGKKLKITSIDSATSFTATVGEEYSMYAGDSVTVEGKTVKLKNVGTSNAEVEIDGVSKSLTTGSTTTVNGIEVYVDSVTNRNTLAESSAILVLGKQARESYADGEAFVGEDEDDPNWVWDLDGLTTNGTSSDCTGSNLILRVENDFVMNDDSDNPTGVGQCIDLPNNYLSICLDILSVVDSDYKEYVMELDLDFDATDAYCAGAGFDTDTPAIYLHTDVSEGFELPAYTDASGLVGNITSTKRAKEVWLVPAAESCDNDDQGYWLNVMYKPAESGSKVTFFGGFNTSVLSSFTGATEALSVLKVNHGNTKGLNMKLGVSAGSTGDNANWTTVWVLDADTDADLMGGVEKLDIDWGTASGFVDSLGDDRNTEEAEELRWVPGAGRDWTTTSLGTKDEDHRLGYGVIVIDPKSQSSSDKVKLLVPSDQVFANVIVKGSSAKVTSGSTSYVPTKVSPVMMAASKVASPTSYNLIVVGGPCANPLAESVFGQTCDGWAYAEGEALVKLAANGDKVAMLVAGTSALDTQRAGKALAAYDKYAFSGTEVLVKGATLTDITVEKPTVAAPVVEEAAAEEVVA
ncbi:MAG: hypothetical protein PHO02_06650 [Candidatus Nanoarchaeia archaeon]|nr:hypothetical protein [Candidatus Nanoarchaeia archaeon]